MTDTECQHDDHENGVCIDCGAQVDWVGKTFQEESDE